MDAEGGVLAPTEDCTALGWHRATALDAALVLGVPLALVLVFLAPLPLRRDLILSYDSPTLRSVYLSHFVHLRLGHLIANLTGYALLVPTAYLLSLLGGHRRTFHTTFVGALLGIPLAVSGLEVWLRSGAVAYGFSAVLTAYWGVVGIALLGFAARQVDPALGTRHAPALFFTGATLVALLFTRTTAVTAVVAVLAAAFGLGHAVRLTGALASAHRRGAFERLVPGQEELAVVAVTLFLGYPLVAFGPSDVASTSVSRYAHLLGFCLAFVAAYVVYELDG